MRRILIAAAVAGLLLAGCGEKKLDHGEVISKVHEPETNTLIFVPICTPVGQSSICTPIPFYLHDGEDWKLELLDRETGKTGWDYVDAGTWTKTQIGDHVEKATTKDPTLRETKK